MNTVKLGNTGLDITRVGLGTWAIGGPWKFGWGAQDDDESVAAIRRGLELGVNWIDTAAVYGFGHAEEVVARAIRGMSERPLVFTKCSMLRGDDGNVVHSLNKETLRAEVEASLRRLETDAIDLYQIHWPIPADDIEEGWQTLLELRDEGKVRHVGVSNFDVGQLRRVGRLGSVETLQPPYSLVTRGIEDEILPFAQSEGIGVIVYSTMGSGRLTGSMTRESAKSLDTEDWRRNDHKQRFQGEELERALEIVERLRTIATERDVSIGSVAAAWTLANPAVHGAILGFRRPEQVDGILPAAAELRLTPDEVATLEPVPA